MSKKEMREQRWNEQNGICPICGNLIEKDEPELVTRGKRKGLPKKSQDQLRGVWLKKIDPGDGWDSNNLILVHPVCGQNFSNWLYSKPGREWVEQNSLAAELFKTGLAIVSDTGETLHIHREKPEPVMCICPICGNEHESKRAPL